MLVKFLFVVARSLLYLIAKVEISNLDRIPATGGYIIVSNHIGRLDAIVGILLAQRDDTVMLIADKYRRYPFWRWAVRLVDGIWIKRGEADLRALRQVQRRLEAGQTVGLAPEGKRSPNATLMPGKQGAAFLAAKAGVPIIPIGGIGTEDHVVKARLRRLKRLHIQIWVGHPFQLPPLPRKNRTEFLAMHTDEVMCQIAALLPESYRGVYANHPRLEAILTAREPETP